MTDTEVSFYIDIRTSGPRSAGSGKVGSVAQVFFWLRNAVFVVASSSALPLAPDGSLMRVVNYLYSNSMSFSRAGAIAAVEATRRLRRVLPFATRVALMVGGSAAVGFGAAATLATGLGPGPFDVLIMGVSRQTGLPFALSLWLLAGSLTIVAAALGNRPGLGTVAAPLIIGPVIGWCSGFIRATLALAIEPGSEAAGLGVVWQQRPSEVVAAFVVHMLGIVVIGFGAGALITSGLGAGTGDLLAAATSSKLGRSVPLVRTCLELAFIGFGLTLGGQAGVGTILVALTVGPAVRLGHSRVEAAVARVFDDRPDSAVAPIAI